MAASVASPAAMVLLSRRQDQIHFSSSVSIIKYTSSSRNFCSFLRSSHQYSYEPLPSFSARSSRFLPRILCSVACEVDSQKEVDAKKERLKHVMVVKSDQSTNRGVLDIQNSVSSERKMSKKGKDPKQLSSSASKTNRVLDIQNSVSSERKKMSKKGKDPKQLSSSASKTNRVEYFQVIRYLLITESAMQNITYHNTLVFVVHEEADKKSIRDAAKKLFKVETKKINTSIMPDGTKKAYLMLTPNHNAADLAKKIKAI